MTDNSDSGPTPAGPSPVFWTALVVLGVGTAFALLVFLATVGPGPGRSGQPASNQHQALQRIERFGGIVPHEWHEDSYRLWFLTITLGPDWTGSNEDLANLRAVNEVYELILDSPDIDDRGLGELHKLRLEGLTAKSTRITDVGLGHLKDVRGLEMLRLDGSQITDAGLKAIQNHDLMWLMLEGDCQVTDAGLAHLAEMKRLIRLELPGADVTGPGLAHLSRLVQLRSLVLRDSQIDDESLRHLTNLTRLQRLNLSGARLTGPGLAHLIPLQRLEELYLDNTSLTDDDLQHVAQLDQLVFVSLIGTKVTEAGLEQLNDMPRLQTALLEPVDEH
jgi:uncharacterized protein YjbI with pentapeptide repeats